MLEPVLLIDDENKTKISEWYFRKCAAYEKLYGADPGKEKLKALCLSSRTLEL